MNTNLSSGQVVAGYRIESFIARGGVAAVYRAKDLSLGRDVALKLLDPMVAESETFRQRFVRESQLAASLDHPNIIPIYDADAVDGLLYIAMRYVPGSTLQTLFDQGGPMAIERALALLGQIAGALDTAHAHGLVHRDVKPHNILVTAAGERGAAEHAYLSDFGLTKRAASLSGLTAVGNFLGTIDYIAPEQITGDPVSSRTDVYALGCVLFQALTGQVPFARDHDAAVIYAHINDSPPSARALRPSLPAEVDAVLAQALAKQPTDRHASCSSLIQALRAATSGPQGNRARPVSPEAPTRLTASPQWVGDGVREADRLSVAETRSADQVALSDRDAPTYVGTIAATGSGQGSARVAGRLGGVFPASARARLIIAAIVAAATALGVTAVVASNGSPAVAGRAVLPFADESYPDKGIVVSRVWVLQGRHGDQVHGELLVTSNKVTPTPFVEALPKNMVESASRVVFSPKVSKILRDDPVVELTASGRRSTITYDVPVAPGPVKLSRLREWAAAQQQEAKAFLGSAAPVTLATLTIAPASIQLDAGGPVRLFQLSGLYSNRKPAEPAALAKSVFDITPPGIAAVERHGAVYSVRPLSPGEATVTAYLGPRSAVLKVRVLKPSGRTPGAPTAVSAEPRNASAIVRWSAPSDDGGNPITSYAITAPGISEVPAQGQAREIVVTGLTNGRQYRFVVTAKNAAGAGPGSAPSPAVTPQPDLLPAPCLPAPSLEVAGSGVNSTTARVSWLAAASSGPCTLRGYTVTPGPVVVGPKGTLSADVANLSPPGRVVDVTVTANYANAQVGTRQAATVRVDLPDPDKTPPAIEIRSPVNGQAYEKDSRVTADYSCTDTGSGVATCDGPVANGQAVDTSTLNEHSFSITATDNAGNAAGARTVKYTVVDKPVPPAAPTITTPADGATYEQGATVAASYSCSGADSCVGTVANGDPINTSAAGEYTFNVTATNGAGSMQSTATYTVVVPPPPPPPPPVITTPADGATYEQGATVAASYSCTGADSCVGTVANGDPINTSEPGPHSFTVTAGNAAGSTPTTANYTIVEVPGVDPPPPPVITTPADGATYEQGATVAASYSCTGADSCVGTVANGDPINTSEPGPHSFTVTAGNAAGSTPTTVSYTVVEAAPPSPPPTSAPPSPPDLGAAPITPPYSSAFFVWRATAFRSGAGIWAWRSGW